MINFVSASGPPTYLPTYLPTDLPTCLPILFSVYLSTYLVANKRHPAPRASFECLQTINRAVVIINLLTVGVIINFLTAAVSANEGASVMIPSTYLPTFADEEPAPPPR